MTSHQNPENKAKFRFSLRGLLLSCLLVVVMMIALFPKIITGDYVKVFAKRITVEEEGSVEVSLEYTSSSRTFYALFIDGINYGSSGGGGFPAWPVYGKETLTFSLAPEHCSKLANSQEPLGRLSITEGSVYIIRPREPLVIYEFDAVENTGRKVVVAIEDQRLKGLKDSDGLNGCQ